MSSVKSAECFNESLVQRCTHLQKQVGGSGEGVETRHKMAEHYMVEKHIWKGCQWIWQLKRHGIICGGSTTEVIVWDTAVTKWAEG